MKKVKDIMSTNIVSVTPDTSFILAASLIVSKKVSGLPIIDEHGQCLGIISEKDLVDTLFPVYKELIVTAKNQLYTLNLDKIEEQPETVKNLKVKDLINNELVFVDQNISIYEAATMLIVYKIRRLPVWDGQNLVGIISQGDVDRAILKDQLGL